MRRNKVKNKFSAWRRQTPGAKVARNTVPGYEWSDYNQEWYHRTKFNKVQKVRRYMQSPKRDRTYGKLVTSAAKWRAGFICQVHSTLRKQGKREVDEQYQDMVEDIEQQKQEDLDLLSDTFYRDWDWKDDTDEYTYYKYDPTLEEELEEQFNNKMHSYLDRLEAERSA